MFRHLQDDVARDLATTLVDLGYTSDGDIRAMTIGISPRFVSIAVGGGYGQARLMTLVGKLNTTKVLVSGEVPIITWLKNCLALLSEQPEAKLFRDALEQASMDGATTNPGAPQLPPHAEPNDVEALPRRGDGALEVQIGDDDTLQVQFLLRGSAAARSIGKVMVHRHFDGSPAYLAGNQPDYGLGTGWLVGPGLLITNYHVVTARRPQEPPARQQDFDRQGANTLVLFDYLRVGAIGRQAQSVACVAGDADLDYAVLRLAPGACDDRHPLYLRSTPILRPKDRVLRERVNVLQHPNGGPMRLGFRNNFVVSGIEERLSYLTDTAGGSSGSPICDDEWFVAALHRGFTTIQGEPVMVWGKPISQENFGTPVGQILGHLAANHPALHEEIVAGQAALPADM